MIRLCNRTRTGASHAAVRTLIGSGPWMPAASVSQQAAAFSAATPATPATAAASPSITRPSSSSTSSSSLPADTTVLSTYTLAPPASASSDSESSSTAAALSLERHRRPGFVSTLQRVRLEFRESVIRKLTEPHKVIQEAYGPFWMGEEHRVVASFSPSTDLTDFTLLNDNNFGGTSTCGLELRERLVTDEATGQQSKRYSVVFKGELRPLMPFQNKNSQLRSGKRDKPLPPPASSRDASTPLPVPSQLLSQPPSVGGARSAGLVSKPPPTNQSQSNHLSDLDEPAAPVAPAQPPADKSAAAEAPVPAPVPVAPVRKSFFRLPSLRQPEENGPINGFAALIFPNYVYPELDLTLFDFLSMQVRTDGRAYMFNVRCFSDTFESVDGFVYQARIKEEQPRPMHKLEVRFENFLCTQHGRARSFATALPRGRIQSFGFSVTGPAGPFEIELESIAANVGTPEFELKARAAMRAAAAADLARRTQQRIDQLEKRQRVQVELDRLRSERQAATRKSDFDAGLLRTLLAENARLSARAQEQDTSGFPVEYQEERKREMAEEQARNQTKLAQAQAAQATATAQAAAKPKPIISDAIRREIEQQVQDEMDEEEKEKQVPWGLGDDRTGPAR